MSLKNKKLELLSTTTNISTDFSLIHFKHISREANVLTLSIAKERLQKGKGDYLV